jgi:geranylgeranyl diphosphate synthase type II
MHSIGELKDLVAKELSEIPLKGSPKDLYDPISYMLSLEAKRMRPIALLAACEMFDGDLKQAINPALGIEVFHNFTLMHDDIMDNAPLRRSSQTVHTRWNHNIAILSGDTMFVKACQLMMMTDDKVLRPVLELFHETAIQVCEGQQLDMDFETAADISIDDYIHMITYKTAVLLAASLKLGAVIAGADTTNADHIYEFGKNTGIAFQLKDDLLDIFGDDKKFGKFKGGDIVANKKTFLLLKALELATGEDKLKLNSWISNPTFDASEKVTAVTEIYNRLGVEKLAEEEMSKHFDKAIFHLNQIPVSESKKSVLRGMAEKLMVREN